MNEITKIKACLSENTRTIGWTGFDLFGFHKAELAVETASLPDEIVELISQFENDNFWVIRLVGMVGISMSISVKEEDGTHREAALFLPHSSIKSISNSSMSKPKK